MMEQYFSMRADEFWEDEKNEGYYNQVFTHFSALKGMTLNYFGADSAAHEFKLDDIVFKVLEDPQDGYRSCLGVIEYGNQSNSIFFHQSLAKVYIETYSGDRSKYNKWNEGFNKGYRLVDVDDGHIWIEFGTDNYDDYYPMFIFRHMPKEQKSEI